MSEKGIVTNIFGWTGIGLSSYFFFAPLFPIIKILKGKLAYKDAPYILLMISLLNCILWIVYGLLINDFKIYLNNIIGSGMTLIWITIYIIIIVKKKCCFAFGFIFLLIILVVGITISFYLFVPFDIIGYVVISASILVYAAPGEKIYNVIKTHNYKVIPIFSTIGGFFCTLCWVMYGIYQNDYKIYAPNGAGLFFAVIQILFYLIYYCKRKKEMPDFPEENENII